MKHFLKQLKCKIFGHSWGSGMVQYLNKWTAYRIYRCKCCNEIKKSARYSPDCICPENLIYKDCPVCGKGSK